MTERTTELEVVERRAAAADVVELVLARPDEGLLPAWRPGAHVDLLLADGLVRQYSLAGDPDDLRHWRLGVLREPAGRGGSEFVHTRLVPGSRVVARGPRNNFALADAQRYLFVAGGIGITPLLPMIRAVAARGRPWRLLYGGRSRASMAFVEDVAGYGAAVTIRPQDEFGLLDLDDFLDPAAGTAVYCCGPEPLIAAVEQRSLAWPADTLHVERFAARERVEGAADGTVEVELARSGLVLEVPPDRSILEVVTSAGVDVLSSCEDGVCGTCQTAVLQGEPDHRDSVLAAGERSSGRTMVLCVSRARSRRLVLDL
ncbi:PDR/VanB family oxidoreductase [Pseudonocardia sp. RS010]|uniref:PDR/VanB family oxidoreductase n=1 Tax=Pseudonocardia sp. RS010 TaxID=3385979 RepID=UPI0039A1C9B2